MISSISVALLKYFKELGNSEDKQTYMSIVIPANLGASTKKHWWSADSNWCLLALNLKRILNLNYN